MDAFGIDATKSGASSPAAGSVQQRSIATVVVDVQLDCTVVSSESRDAVAWVADRLFPHGAEPSTASESDLFSGRHVMVIAGEDGVPCCFREVFQFARAANAEVVEHPPIKPGEIMAHPAENGDVVCAYETGTLEMTPTLWRRVFAAWNRLGRRMLSARELRLLVRADRRGDRDA